MARFQYVILSRSKAGQEEEYVSWYRDQHLADVCRMNGVVSGKLLRMDLQKAYDLDPPKWTLLTIYELETDDPQKVIDSILAAVGTEAMPMTDSLDRSGMVQAVASLVSSIG